MKAPPWSSETRLTLMELVTLPGMASQAVWAFYICQEAQQGQNAI